MENLKAEHLIASQSKLGEGCIWHPDEEALYWVDIHQAKIEKYCPSKGERHTFQFNVGVTVLGIRSKGGFVAGTTEGFAFWDGKTEKLELLSNPFEGRPYFRFNDGAVDRQGRFWAGSMYEGPENGPHPNGTLYRMDPDGSVHAMDSDLTIPNGTVWSLDNRTMYVTDTLRRLIYAYDFDPEEESISNRRVFTSLAEGEGYPDGLTMDRRGYMWGARWTGWSIVCYSPTGEVVQKIQMPVACPTCCTFGGKNLQDLYVTSAWTIFSEEERKKQPLAGDLFRIHTDVQGFPEPKFLG